MSVDPPRRPRSAATRARILAAAAVELSERGDDGLRIEHVADRAGCNKALVYRYFGDRAGLIRETLRAQFATRESVFAAIPETPGEALVHWTTHTSLDPTFVRLMLREALADAGEPPVESEARTDYYARQIALMRSWQERGLIDPDMDAEMLFLAMLAVIILPSALPQIVRLAVGLDPATPEFMARWAATLSAIGDALAAAPRHRNPGK